MLVFPAPYSSNDRTAHLEVGLPTPAIVNIAPDRTFTFEIKSECLDDRTMERHGFIHCNLISLLTLPSLQTFDYARPAAPPTSLLLKRAAGITTGSGRVGSATPEGIAGTVSIKHIYEIAKIKMQDVKGVSEENVSIHLVRLSVCCARWSSMSHKGLVTDAHPFP